ncbi:MAG: nuclear transport factor 2 family protein [Deltaproteobacteria bacterium]|nr:nuclear transport factor 2 family protein [Deltaproteobacteria bacterium]
MISAAACAAPPAPPPAAPCGAPGVPSGTGIDAEVARVLDDWHDAAARADEERYFGHFAEGGVFLGTDMTERWTVPAFRKYAHPHFAKGKAWTMRATRREITFVGGAAWFDEDLDTARLGPARGSGVLVRDDAGRWKIAQYNLSIPIPNEKFGEVRAVIDGAAKPAP